MKQPRQLLLPLVPRPIDYGRIDLRSLGVRPVADDVPQPLPPLPGARDLFPANDQPTAPEK